jgi:mRNA interferase MazF
MISSVLRGDIVTVAAGTGYAGKPRPAVVVQANGFEHTLSLVTCPLTTDDVSASLIRLFVEPTNQNGLRKPSWIMVEKITALRRDKIGKHIGRLAATDLARLNTALVVFLGLAG